MSSSGKEYYYNVSSHASQWEKPREWLEYEKKYGPVPHSASVSKPPVQHIHQSQSHPASHQQSEREKLVAQQRERFSGHHHAVPSGGHNYQSSSSHTHQPHTSSANSFSSHSLGHHHGHGYSHSHSHHTPQTGVHGSQQQRHPQHYDSYHEKYVSFGHSSHSVTSSGSHVHLGGYSQRNAAESTPSSSRQTISILRENRKPSEDLNSEDMDISPTDNSMSPSSADSKTLSGAIISSTSQPQMIFEVLRDESKSSDKHRNINGLRDRDRDIRINRDSDRGRREAERGRTREREPRTTDHERSRSHARDERSQSPWDKDGTPERQDGNEPTTGTGLNSLGRLSSLGNESEMSALAPLPSSLAVYYREDLIQHVKNLASDPADRQASRLGEELMTSSAIQLSKVSTELKMARSLVRLTDIQATLQEQRILFLREQIRNLEESDKDNSAMLGVETSD